MCIYEAGKHAFASEVNIRIFDTVLKFIFALIDVCDKPAFTDTTMDVSLTNAFFVESKRQSVWTVNVSAAFITMTVAQES